MSHPRRVAVVALVVPLALALVACGDDDEEGAKKAAASPCPAGTDQSASTPLPADLPTPEHATVYRYFSQGKTRVWEAAVAGGPDDLVRLRDGYDRMLTAHGYRIGDTDQEDGAEAESEYSGPHDGTTRWRPMCSGKDVVRLVVTR